jgi:HEAT repeat protein
VDTLGELGENEVLGIFAYILLNDRDALVRKEAADELGDFAHPHSLDVLAKALKDPSPIVRKEAIEGLKKIKKKNKPEKKVEVEKEEEKPPETIENVQEIADNNDLEESEEESEKETLKEIEVEDEDSYEQ